MRFDTRNPRAERWLSEQSSRLVTEITQSTQEAIRLIATSGLEAGKGPRAVALDIVGRLNRRTRQREGGVIGLTSQQAGWAETALDELTSGDPAAMRNYLTRRARDKRFDRSVMRAIRDGRPVPAADAQRMVRMYRSRLLRMRGETIARTEMLASLHAAQDEGLRQLADRGVPADAITRHWDDTHDSATRVAHRELGAKYDLRGGVGVGVGEAFVSDMTGHRLLHPGDASQGAPADMLVNCRCRVRVNIDNSYLLRRG